MSVPLIPLSGVLAALHVSACLLYGRYAWHKEARVGSHALPHVHDAHTASFKSKQQKPVKTAAYLPKGKCEDTRLNDSTTLLSKSYLNDMVCFTLLVLVCKKLRNVSMLYLFVLCACATRHPTTRQSHLYHYHYNQTKFNDTLSAGHLTNLILMHLPNIGAGIKRHQLCP